jgi:hypothetical protein
MLIVCQSPELRRVGLENAMRWREGSVYVQRQLIRYFVDAHRHHGLNQLTSLVQVKISAVLLAISPKLPSGSRLQFEEVLPGQSGRSSEAAGEAGRRVSALAGATAGAAVRGAALMYHRVYSKSINGCFYVVCVTTRS